MIQMLNDHFMPSGIPAGSELAGPMRTALEAHAGLPIAYQAVIEDGTYDQIKACIFRVLSYRICEVAMEDVKLECREHRITCEMHQREWKYFADPTPKCVTAVSVRMVGTPDMDMQSFLEYLANKYGFRYNRMQTNRRAITQIDRDHVFLDPSVEIEAEIVWPYWT